MRTWQTIVLSAAAATIGDGLLLWSVTDRSNIEVFALAYLILAASIWIVLYAVFAFFLTTVTRLADILRASDSRSVRKYLEQLVFVQYFTGVLLLFGLGLSRVPVDASTLFGAPAIISKPILAAAVGLSVLGIVGWVLVTIAEALGGWNIRRRLDKFSELQMLRETLALLRAPERAKPQTSNAGITDPAAVVKLVKQAQRPILQVLQDLALTVSDLRQSIGEIHVALHNREPTPDDKSLSALDGATADLRDAVAVLTSSTARLAEFVSVLSVSNIAIRGEETVSIGSRVQVSRELHGLLEEMTRGPNGKDKGSEE